MESICGNPDHADSHASVQKRLIEVFSLIQRHPAIFSSLAVEDEVDGDESPAEDASAIEDPLCEIASRRTSDLGRLDVRALEGGQERR